MTTAPRPAIATSCAGCGSSLEVDLSAGTVRAGEGQVKALNYADEALAVWDCPSCGQSDAEDLLGG